MSTELKEDFGVSQHLSEEGMSRNINAKKFRTLLKEYFELEINLNNDPVQKVKETSRLLSFSLPSNLNEIFLRPEESHLLWVLSTPLNNYLEDYFKQHFTKSSGLELIKQANESYQKWVFNKSASEKKYFANSFINLADKKFANNFWLYLLMSSIYMNERSILNFARSIEMLEKAKEVITASKITDHYKEVLNYYISVLKGFAELKQNNFMAANSNFTEALRTTPFGITAKFYLSLSETLLDNKEVARHLVSEILNYDHYRCLHAVNSNSAGMLHFFVHFPVITNLFYYSEFAFVAETIEGELMGVKGSYENSYDELQKKLTKLEELQLSEFINPDTSKSITFIAQIISVLKNSKSVLFYNVFPEIEEKYKAVITSIVDCIRQKYYDEVKERVVSFNIKIERNLEDIEKIKDEQEAYLKKLKDRLKESIEAVENEIAEEIAFIEDRINNIPNVNSLNPRSSFNKAMVFNIVLSVVVFLMGGCSGYTDSFLYNVWEFKEVVTLILVAGLKWGGIAFFIGMLISFFVAGYVTVERSNEKQKLIKKIGQLKSKKENDIDELNRDFSSSEKTVISNFIKKISDKNGENKILAEEKEEREKVYYAEADEKIKEEFVKMQEILSETNLEEI